jgi:hypothetical protein
MDLAADCVQHKLCLIAQSCGIEVAVNEVSAVNEVVQAKIKK